MNAFRPKLIGAALVAVILLAAASILWLDAREEESKLPPHLQFQRSLSSTGEIADFTLLDQRGVIHSLYRYGGAKAVVIVSHGNGCPIVQKLAQRMNTYQADYASKGVVFLMLNANTEDDRKSLMQEAQEYGLEVPILMDPSQIVGKLLNFKRTAEAVVLDPKSWKVVYRGAVTDQLDYGVDKQVARSEYLREVLDAFLARKELPYSSTEVKGCLISYWQNKQITFEKDIFPILENKCLSCHSQGGKFPPFFVSFEKLRGWSAMIRETIYTDRMPPFSADTFYGNYVNDVSLTPREKNMLVEWIDAGMPRDAAQAHSDPLQSYVRKKKKEKVPQQKKEPILVREMDTDAVIRPTGEIEYHYYQLGDKIPQDMWINSIWVKSTNPRQLHHASLMVVPKPLEYYQQEANKRRDEELVRRNKDGDIPVYTLMAMLSDEESKDANLLRLQIWGLGRKQPVVYRSNLAAYLPKDYYLILETHYMGTGREERERSRVEFYGSFQREGRSPIRTLMLRTDKIEIPPHAARHITVTPEHPFARDMEITGFLAHLHMRGRSVKVVRRHPDQSEDIILSIPNFYYGWQTGTGVVPEKPILVTKGSKLRVVCEHDNSAYNPFNPDPTKTVFYGQTHDRAEMCKVNLQMREL